LRFIGHTSGRKVRTRKTIDLYSSEGNSLFNGWKPGNGVMENYIAERERFVTCETREKRPNAGLAQENDPRKGLTLRRREWGN
jgi:hypothetical protein